MEVSNTAAGGIAEQAVEAVTARIEIRGQRAKAGDQVGLRLGSGEHREQRAGCPGPDRIVEVLHVSPATNHLGHFALANGLRRAMAEARGARIVSVSSSAHQLSPVVFDDLHFRFRAYDPMLSYGQSKTANILFAVEATRRWAGAGITANSLTPGAIATNLQRYRGGMSTPPELRKTVEEARRRRCLPPRHPCSRASAAGTSSTAMRPKRCSNELATRPASRPTPWTQEMQNGSGKCLLP